jgi:hypothetical protein
MKFLSLILLFLWGWFGGSYFSVHQATRQSVFGGRAQSGKSVNYQIKMIANCNSSKLKFDSIWVNNELLPLKVYRLNSAQQIDLSFSKGDTIFVEAQSRILPNERGVLVATVSPSKSPIEFSGAALVMYTYKGKHKHYVLESFQELARVNLP